MTQENENILIRDLCSRLPYRVKCFVPIENSVMELTGKRLNYFCFHKEEWGFDYSHELEVVLDPLNDMHNEQIIKPYLRSMSSMTTEECIELGELPVSFESIGKLLPNTPYYIEVIKPEQIDWLNAHHFDYRGLIEKGLALEAPKGMYN